MKVSERMRVVDADDESLRRLTHEHLKVFAKFTSENCDICEQLAPPFTKFADQKPFEHVLFLRLNSDENPVAKKLMQEKVAPFFVSYCQGRILECDALTTEQEVHDMLQRLRDFVPVSA
ncbi:thioredoxin family protein [Hymenobacter cavernae]|nr:thioredoxin family protein [Hymenobacter cavernae]